MGTWVSVNAMLAQHRKARLLAVRMEFTEHELVGGLLLFWSAVRIQAPDGDISGWSDQEIGLSAGFEGSTSERLGRELKSCGFIDLDGHVHDWDEHNGKYLKEAVRMKNYRERKRNEQERTRTLRYVLGEQEQEQKDLPHPTPPYGGKSKSGGKDSQLGGKP